MISRSEGKRKERRAVRKTCFFLRFVVRNIPEWLHSLSVSVDLSAPSVMYSVGHGHAQTIPRSFLLLTSYSLPFPFPRYVYPAYTFKFHGVAFLKSRAQLMYSGVRFPRCRRTPRTRLRPLVGFYAPVDSTAYTPRDSAHMRARPNAFTSIYPKRRALSFSRSFCL